MWTNINFFLSDSQYTSKDNKKTALPLLQTTNIEIHHYTSFDWNLIKVEYGYT